MKRIIITVLLFISCSLSTYAQTQFSKTIGRIENSLFGVEYTNQSDTKRLERIEENVYGEPAKGSVKERLNKLSKDISADVIGQEIAPKEDSFAEDEPKYVEQDVVADSSVDYPLVNEMEKQIFKKEYKTMDIKKRLENLEKSTFKTAYAQDDLNTRMERLKSSIAVQSPRAKEEYDNFYSENFPSNNNYYTQQDNYAPSDKYTPKADNFATPDNYYTADNNGSYYPTQQNAIPDYMKRRSVLDDDIIAQRDLKAKINSLEKSVLKQSYSSDTVENRLSRLENSVFSTNFSEDSEVTRINRLASATKAQKTAKKYDTNSLAQKMSTVMQIGLMVLMVVAMVL